MTLAPTRPDHPVPGPGVAVLGGPGSVLLSGPPEGDSGELLSGHVARWGPVPPLDGAAVRDVIRRSALDGRGGGGFPLARKLDTARLGGGRPVLVVNASESEPVSAKDTTLCRHRPHLLLDGAALVARALGTAEVTLHVHRGPRSPTGPLAAAIGERIRAGLPDPVWRISEGPDRYVSGESSAVASAASGGPARPHFSEVPLAVRGPGGLPTVVSNVETVAHVAVAARRGAEVWRASGGPGAPGTRLVTVTGAVAHPGTVLEVVGPVRVGHLLVAAGLPAPPAAVLMGGFAGTWVDGNVAWSTPFDRESLRAVGAAPGCGLVAVLPSGACALAETARITAYLAGESAGQCGACVAGLPRLAAAMDRLASGSLRRGGARRIRGLAHELVGSGACSHPDGVARLVASTLDVFEDDVVRHLAGAPCRGVDQPPVLAVPEAARP